MASFWRTQRHMLQVARPIAVRMAQVVCVSILIGDNVAQVQRAEGTSMMPTLALRGDIVVVVRPALCARWRAWRGETDAGGVKGKGKGSMLRLGDLVVATSVTHPDRQVLKRVLGLEGDTVLLDPRASSCETEPWLDSTREEDLDEEVGPPEHGAARYITVPRGHMWLVGDNLPMSNDSRHYGPVPLGLLKGVVVAKVVPEMHWLGSNLEPLP
ncbi:LexA/Signal peptidase [Tilletiopsis washingtonensis]|uniref:Mitochondrial inner membrane protease subunit n=1 Tax=Tilletiopsis washingtonensis TaxID=58919 RepID=A0A316Z8L9_9BASI|nr:LexA/Signal peptidase [Tilletiopsis washingtonensis]PWN97921.1 LexA/Signal peptidase [Tilletiopsis washingtonensis]